VPHVLRYRRGEAFVFGGTACQWVEALPQAARVDHDDAREARAIAGGRGEELAFQIIDDDRALPGQKLADGEQSLARPGRPDDQGVGKLAPLRGWLHGYPGALVAPQQQASGRRTIGQQRPQVLTGRPACRAWTWSLGTHTTAVL